MWVSLCVAGSTSELTLEITDTIQNMVGMECQMHLTCTNMPLESIVNALEVCKEKGIRNILALRGGFSCLRRCPYSLQYHEHEGGGGVLALCSPSS